MSEIELRGYQKEAIEKMFNGCILCGGVGSGKSLTSLSYYYICQGGKIGDKFEIKKLDKPQDLYIITTAKKRDSQEWQKDMMIFDLCTKEEYNGQNNKVIVDSWNNIKKYENVTGAFFIFDEQRVVGWGAWSKSFVKIARANNWILLSATPGDKYEDYMPVFIANNFYKNKTEFTQRHIIYDPNVKFPKVYRYLETRRMDRLRDKILITMNYVPPAEQIHEFVYVDYDIVEYNKVVKGVKVGTDEVIRFNPYTGEPITNASEFCYTLRHIVNEDPSRIEIVKQIAKNHQGRIIIFYNFDYELGLLKRTLGKDYVIAEWNGHKHQDIPNTNEWIYLVQYNAGNEGWNCISTDTIIFFSPNYSYRMTVQAAGRIDRMNTPYKKLYYYHLMTRSNIDISIAKALKAKKKFNETSYTRGMKFYTASEDKNKQ